MKNCNDCKFCKFQNLHIPSKPLCFLCDQPVLVARWNFRNLKGQCKYWVSNTPTVSRIERFVSVMRAAVW
jgi:hypothetical protein